jgi:hypothetical protein
VIPLWGLTSWRGAFAFLGRSATASRDEGSAPSAAADDCLDLVKVVKHFPPYAIPRESSAVEPTVRLEGSPTVTCDSFYVGFGSEALSYWRCRDCTACVPHSERQCALFFDLEEQQETSETISEVSEVL